MPVFGMRLSSVGNRLLFSVAHLLSIGMLILQRKPICSFSSTKSSSISFGKSDFVYGESGLRKSAVKPSLIIAIGLLRYIALPISGIAVDKVAEAIGFLPQDAMFGYVLLTGFTLPPALAIEYEGNS